MAGGARDGDLRIRPLAPSRADDVSVITQGSWGVGCWDLHWRFTAAGARDAGIAGKPTTENMRRRREIVAKLARRRRNAPMLVAYVSGEPAGFVALGPRSDFDRVRASKATPPVDDVPAWVIPCITVRPPYRGRGVAVALLRASVDYAAKRGAPAIEGYPRAEGKRIHDDLAFIGTEALFRKAGFRKVRGVMADLPHGWARRVTMRASCVRSTKTPSASRTRSRAES
jgi:GNAT superfamily N-acetyltransferase